MNFIVKLFFFKSISNILNLLKYSNVIDIYLDRLLYYNLIIKSFYFKNLLKNKNNLKIFINSMDNKISNFIFFNIFNFFLVVKKNLFKLLKNTKIFFFF